MEKETKVDVYRIDYYCDKCGHPMAAGESYGPSPITHVHNCTHCVHVVHITGKRYPDLEYRDIVE